MFYRDGINVTGIDRIIARAGVAKASLYNNFASKDELVAAYLRGALERARELFATCLAEPDPPARLRALFSRLARGAATSDFAGCPFANAAAELGPSEPGLVVVAQFDAALADFFARAVEDSPDSPLVRRLVVCYVGALHGAKVRRDPRVVEDAADLALASWEHR